MNDGHRKYPVNIFVLHHSTGPKFTNASDLVVQDWFSRVGKARGYQGGAINPNHEHPGRKGQLTYAMAQFAGFPYTKDGNKYGYRLIDLIKRPWKNVAWHAGNWDINVHSAGLENCGNYMNQVLSEKQLMCIADWLRPLDDGLDGGLTILLHQEVFATACPGRIKEQRNKLVDMINQPAKWNKKLWPPKKPTPKPEPKPEPTPEPITLTNKVTYSPAKTFKLVDDTKLVNIPQGNQYSSKTYTAGTNIGDVVELREYSNGKAFYRTKYARDSAKKLYGFKAMALREVVEQPKPEPTPEPQPETDYAKQNNGLLKNILVLLRDLLSKITSIFK